MAETLMDVSALRRALEAPGCVVLDCRFRLDAPGAGQDAYRAGHIPGAHYADLERDLSAARTLAGGRHPLPSAPQWAAACTRWGIGPETQVVTYDDQGGVYAARAWWMLRAGGHQSVAVLEGGWSAWLGAAGPTAVGGAAPPSRPQRSWSEPSSVGTEEIAMCVRNGSTKALLLDARGPVRFRGEEEPLDRVAGHVPGAVNCPFTGNLGPHGDFLTPAQLKARFMQILGAKAPTDVIHMCGSGVSACHNLLAMEYAGLAGSRLYVGSWSAWCADPARPVATGV